MHGPPPEKRTPPGRGPQAAQLDFVTQTSYETTSSSNPLQIQACPLALDLAYGWAVPTEAEVVECRAIWWRAARRGDRYSAEVGLILFINPEFPPDHPASAPGRDSPA